MEPLTRVTISYFSRETGEKVNFVALLTDEELGHLVSEHYDDDTGGE